jgi:hypothetical protein
MTFYTFRRSFTLISLSIAVMGACGLEAAPQNKPVNGKKTTYTPAKKTVTRKQPAKTTKPVSKQPAKKPATKPVQKPIAQTNKGKNTEAQVQALFKRFVNLQTTISWKCFSQQLATLLAGQPKYKSLVTELKKLRTETNQYTIGSRIKAYKHLLTPDTNKLLKQYNVLQMCEILEKRIALNNKSQC